MSVRFRSRARSRDEPRREVDARAAKPGARLERARRRWIAKYARARRRIAARGTARAPRAAAVDGDVHIELIT